MNPDPRGALEQWPRRRPWLSIALLAFVPLFPAGCERSLPPSVVLFSVDTLRADALGCYGQPLATSPAIDAFAAEAAVFEQAISPASWTLPAHASMLTGVLPARHGAIDATRAIDPSLPTLAQRLHEHGYWTAAVVNAPFLDPHFGFDRGFDRYLVVPRGAGSRAVETQMFELLAEAGNRRPFFLFLHTMAVHSPYLPPPETDVFQPEIGPVQVDGRRVGRLQDAMEAGEVELTAADFAFLRASYLGEVRALDDSFSRIWPEARDALGEGGFLVLTSDHGEEFGEHGGLQHNDSVFEELMQVPLIVRGPGFSPGSRVGTAVSTVDLAATIQAAVGLEVPELDGTPLSEPGRGAPLRLLGGFPREAPRWFGLRSEGWKWVVDDDGCRFYDLREDPDEKAPVPGPPRFRERSCESWRADLDPSEGSGSGPEITLDPEMEADLRALGYIR